LAGRSERSLPYLFLDVEADQTEQVLSFTKRFGVLGNTKRTGWSYAEREKKKARRTLNRFTRALPAELNKVRFAYIDDLIDVHLTGAPPESELCEPMTTEAFKHAQELMQLLVDTLYQTRTDPDAIPENFSNLLSWKLSAVRPRLIWSSQALRWETAWDVGSLEAAMYLMLFFDIQGRGHILKCPRCNTFFLGDHPRTEYCSSTCQNNAKVARHRAKKSGGGDERSKPSKENKHG
jgi:hypothetical protein